MPRNLTTAEQVETLVNAVPETGEIAYNDLATAVIASGNKDALNHLFPLKHQGRLILRTEFNEATGKSTTYVSRA